MKKLIIAIVLSGVTLLSGCATTPPVNMQDAVFTSEPSGATVTIAGKSCTTPCSLKLNIHAVYTIRMSKAEHYPNKQQYAALVPTTPTVGMVMPVLDLAVAAVTIAEQSANPRYGFHMELRPKKETEEYCASRICV